MLRVDRGHRSGSEGGRLEENGKKERGILAQL